MIDPENLQDAAHLYHGYKNDLEYVAWLQEQGTFSLRAWADALEDRVGNCETKKKALCDELRPILIRHYEAFAAEAKAKLEAFGVNLEPGGRERPGYLGAFLPIPA